MFVPGLSATEVLAALARGDFTTEELVETLLSRADALRSLNAFIQLEAESVRAASRRADLLRRQGRSGLLGGLPFAVKDNIDVAGVPTTDGTAALAENRPGSDAALVRILRAHGGIPFGKTNQDELCFGFTSNNQTYGAVRNPHAPDRIPGGSSGGSAVAVAARIVPVALGTDTAGSVRVPAALCGVIGFRPSTGRYSSEGIVPLCPTRDTPGVIARTVADVALLDQVITGDAELSPLELRGLRFGAPRGLFRDQLDPAVRAAVEAELSTLAGLGVEIIEADLEAAEGCLDRCRPIIDREISVELRAYIERALPGSTLDALVAGSGSAQVRAISGARFMKKDGGWSNAEYVHALHQERPTLIAAYESYFAEHHLDALIVPTSPAPAARLGEDTLDIEGTTIPLGLVLGRNTGPSSLAGVPALSLPVGLTSKGLPVGIDVQAPAGSDRTLFAIAAAIEASHGPLAIPKST